MLALFYWINMNLITSLNNAYQDLDQEYSAKGSGKMVLIK